MHDNCSLTQINQCFFRQNLECMCSGWKTGFSVKLKIVRAKTLGRRAHHPWKTKICLATRGGLSSPAGPWKVERNTTPLPCHSNFLDLSVSIETSLFIARSGWSEHESVHICHHGLAPWCAHRPRSSRPRPQPFPLLLAMSELRGAKPQTPPHLSNHGHHHWLCHGVSQPEAQIHIPLGHRAKLVKVKAHLYESSRYFSYAHESYF